MRLALAGRILQPSLSASKGWRFSISNSQPRRLTTPAMGNSSNNVAETADPRAASIMSYWYGAGWATAPRLHWDGQQAAKWFRGGKAVDDEIKAQFMDLLADAAAGKLDPWIEHPVNCLAGVVLMDQFSRNAYRGTPQAFALDTKALTWAKHALATGRCESLPWYQKLFLLLPFEHSEKLEDQEECLRLCEKLVADIKKEVAEAGLPGPPTDRPLTIQDEVTQSPSGLMAMTMSFYEFAQAHRDVIKKWGRFPHRNAILGRASTPEEEAGLKDGSIKSF